jgi:hypothetical protein
MTNTANSAPDPTSSDFWSHPNAPRPSDRIVKTGGSR